MTGEIAPVPATFSAAPPPFTDAVEDPPAEEEAPYGWMTDPDTGERRPKKRPGRRSRTARVPSGKTPSLTELQGLGTLPEASEDTAPGTPPKQTRAQLRATRPRPELPPFRAGVIAKAVNREYRRAGRIVRMWHVDIGNAIIASATQRPADPDDGDDLDLTVGEAWEALAKTNPRIRLVLHRILQTSDLGALFKAHLPILLAVLMIDGIRQRIPFLDMAQAFLSDDPQEGGEPDGMGGLGGAVGMMGPEDMAQMMAMAQGLMGQMASQVPRPAGSPRVPEASEPEFEA